MIMVADNVADKLAAVTAQKIRRNNDNAAALFATTKQMANTLHLTTLTPTIINVAGTNGKGSCVALLESIYLAAGYRVATLTSPHLLTINERIRINGSCVDDESLCQALAQVSAACGEVALGFFISLYLAALIIFSQQTLDVIIIEAGIGGRYDASNSIDANLAIITSIALDHCNILGHSRDAIALEKGGIMRQHRPLICGDRQPPANLQALAQQQQVPYYQLGRDFELRRQASGGYQWSSGDRQIAVPPGQLFDDNIATAIMAVEQLQSSLPVSLSALRQGIGTAVLPARCQYIEGSPAIIIDVAHNVAAVTQLRDDLLARSRCGRRHAIFGWLADKEGVAMAALLAQQVDAWYLAAIDHDRAADMTAVRQWLHAENYPHQAFVSPTAAFEAANAAAREEDIIILFGSFHLVGEVWSLVNRKKESI